MLRNIKFWVPLILVATVAVGGTLVDQGKPGKQGAWPTTSVQGVGIDGGTTWSMREDWKLINPVTSAVSCGTTATAITNTANRTTLTLKNNSGSTIYIGGSAVTTANGLTLLNGESFSDNVLGYAYYCIVASGTAELRVLEN